MFKLKGINSDTDICEICGKTNLKKVMWLTELDADGNETGDVFAAGTTCGSRKLGITGSKATKERKIQELALQQLKDTQNALFADETKFRLYNNYYYLKDMIADVVQGYVSRQEHAAERLRRYPFLKYWEYDGISLEKALGYCQVFQTKNKGN